jgi:hypothetical protein
MGSETWVRGKIVSGPHKWTPDELATNIRVNEEAGYSTRRMCKSYWVVRAGRAQLHIHTTSIKAV